LTQYFKKVQQPQKYLKFLEFYHLERETYHLERERERESEREREREKDFVKFFHFPINIYPYPIKNIFIQKFQNFIKKISKFERERESGSGERERVRERDFWNFTFLTKFQNLKKISKFNFQKKISKFNFYRLSFFLTYFIIFS